VRSARDPIRRIVASYDARIVRWYSRVRFTILRQSFLEEIGQYLPRSGRILDVGCGFGLFSLYFAAQSPGRRIVGIDRDPRRIALARASAARLGIEGVEYRVCDALEWKERARFDAVYSLDLVHHVPRASVPRLLTELRDSLRPGGRLLLKEVEDQPAWKRWFTLALDRVMVGREPVHYWSAAELGARLEGLGFEVMRHRMRDVLPYPHILYVSRLVDRLEHPRPDAGAESDGSPDPAS
jgi:2-polyprenyl-3-methyl-5-hydroxy-6-metoxy-1,4-benzoquinol methylase